MKIDGIKKEIDFLQAVLERPGMFLVNSVHEFYLVSLGMSYGLDDEKGFLLNAFFQEFTEYLSERLHVSKENVPWFKLIDFCSSTNTHSLILCKKHFQEYIKQSTKRV